MTPILERYQFVPGYIESPPDERDFHVDDLYGLLGVEKPVLDALPASFLVPNPPPILNQGLTPQCTVFAVEAAKAWQDFDDRDPHRWYNFDENALFRASGGSSRGAVLRDVLDRVLKVGYPIYGVPNSAAAHRILGYYAVPKTKYDIMAALVALGPLVTGTTWWHSWTAYKYINDTLPRPDYDVGGHATAWVGYNPVGPILQNSWGKSFAGDGRVTVPWAYALQFREIWKTRDR